MSLVFKHNIGFNITPEPHPNTKIGVLFSPLPLLRFGFNLLVTISTASLSSKSSNFDKSLLSSINVMAHLDTGASITSIDIELAKHLKLIPTGTSSSHTAAGLKEMLNYVIDLNFPNTNLRPFINLPISSCKLPFDIKGDLNDSRKNFGLLLGRDILSHWNVVWNGETSTVFIND